MSWTKHYTADNIKPAELDTTSSKVYNFIRKDFKLIPESGEDDHIITEHWEWMEQKIRKEDWEFYQTLTDHTATLSDVEDALIELAEIITEG